MTIAVLVVLILAAFWITFLTASIADDVEKAEQKLEDYVDEQNRQILEMIFNMDRIKEQARVEEWTDC